MDNKKINFGDLWWHRVLNVLYYTCYILDYTFVILVSGGAAYLFLTEAELSLYSSIFASGGVAGGLFIASITILETVKYIFFYIYKNETGKFKADFTNVFKKESTIISIILILIALYIGTIFGYRDAKKITDIKNSKDKFTKEQVGYYLYTE